MDAAALLDDLARGLREGAVVPWLGPGVHTAAPFPAGPSELAAWLQARSPVPGRIRGNLGSVAQYIEQNRHRRTLDRLLAQAFPAPAAASPAHRLLAGLPRLPLVVDAWYDATWARILAAEGRKVALVHGVDRTGQLDRFFAAAAAPGFAPEEGAETLVYQPCGTAWPRPSFLVSDADWVEVLTEIDIQTPIPPAVQGLRSGRRFLFLGQRFTAQLDRILARQVTKRSGAGHVAVFPGPMTRNEERFLAAAGIDRVDAPVEAFTAALAARQGPLAAAPAGGRTLEDLRRLGDAEAFFAFFDLPFVPEVVRVYRLHILKRFALEMEVVDRARPDAPEAERLALYREALARAHDLFTRSTAQREKLFRVFHGEGVVTIGRAP